MEDKDQVHRIHRKKSSLSLEASLTQEASFSQSLGSQDSRQNLRQNSRDRFPNLFRHNAVAFDVVAFNYQGLEDAIADLHHRYDEEHDLGDITETFLEGFDITMTQPSLDKINEGLVNLVAWMAQEINGKLASYVPLTRFYRDVKRAIIHALEQDPANHNLVSDIKKIWDKTTYLITGNDDDDLESTEDDEEFNQIRAEL